MFMFNFFPKLTLWFEKDDNTLDEPKTGAKKEGCDESQPSTFAQPNRVCRSNSADEHGGEGAMQNPSQNLRYLAFTITRVGKTCKM